MKTISITLILLAFSLSASSQWRSYYPESKVDKKMQEKIDFEKNKKLFDSHFFDALRAKSLEDYEEALKYFEKCTKIDEKNPNPFYESAIINTQNSNYNIAVEQVKKAIKLDSENRWYLLLYAEILFKKQDFENTAKQYKKLLAIEPGNEELYFKLADTYIYAADFKNAIRVYNDLERYKGVDKILSMQKHKLYRQINDVQSAINELNVILKIFPHDTEVMEILSELYLLNDEKEKAFELLKQISVINPKNGRIHLTLADYYREAGDNQKSYNELKLAFKSIGLNIDTKIRILVSYYQLIEINQEMRDQAYELAEILISTHPEDIKARAVLADILYTDRQYKKAKEQYLIILEKDKTKSQIWSQVLFIQAEQNDFEEMLQTSKEALEYFPSDPLFYYFNGISNKWAKNYNIAISSLKNGVDFVIENQNLLLEFYSSLGDAYHATKQYKLSDEYYEKALDIDPDNIIVLNNYAYYLSLRKQNLEKAKKMSFRCNQIERDNGTYQDTYAWVLYQLKDYTKAKEWLTKALLNGGDKSAVIIEHYGDVLYKLNEKDEALNQWKRAKKLGGASEFIDKKIEERKIYE